tara:strand:- start:2646 stop:3191 length:546 start_codon:yes stop_codon:yes gene_type:complete
MRVFIAIEICNLGILKKIQIFQDELKINAKPIRIDQIHFTLKFLGEIGEEKCEQVKNALKKLEFRQFELSLQGVGAFPNFKNPRIIWIGCDKQGAEKLSNIAKEIGNNLVSLGFEKDKKFKPHLTVFRVKNKIDDISLPMKEFIGSEFGTQGISKIKLKRSILSPKGPEYSDLLEVNGNEK